MTTRDDYLRALRAYHMQRVRAEMRVARATPVSLSASNTNDVQSKPHCTPDTRVVQSSKQASK